MEVDALHEEVKRSVRLNSWRKNTQNGVFTCSNMMPDSLPRFTRCAVDKIGDNRHSNANHMVRSHWTPAQLRAITCCLDQSNDDTSARQHEAS
ncbi:hypothetical protein Scep_007407 [Stephania cephalantha]|uniref:Uncharacterized protein n=1 Tax=Stephania cephalantha TaxID=152367 RepID=A0AAP0KCH4_9MAGN